MRRRFMICSTLFRCPLSKVSLGYPNTLSFTSSSVAYKNGLGTPLWASPEYKWTKLELQECTREGAAQFNGLAANRSKLLYNASNWCTYLDWFLPIYFPIHFGIKCKQISNGKCCRHLQVDNFHPHFGWKMFVYYFQKSCKYCVWHERSYIFWPY